MNYVLDLDIKSFFDKVGHEHMERFIRHRIGDERMVRLILKWVKAGVIEDGQWHETKEGTPQGAVISPLLANLYLHYVLDVWVQQWREKEAQGGMIEHPAPAAALAHAHALAIAQVVFGVLREEDAVATALGGHASTLPSAAEFDKKPTNRA